MQVQSVSHDGAESRLNYENQEIEDLPQSLVISEIDDIGHQNVGHGFRDRYDFVAEMIGETESYQLEVTVTDYGDSESVIRGSYVEDDSQVFFGSSELSAEELIRGDGEIRGEVLERRY